MGSFSKYLQYIKDATVTIFEGMAVTLSWMFRRPMTIQYPDRTEKPVKEMLPERFRGVLEVDTSACTACTACARACPIDVIMIETAKVPGGKGRLLTRFDIDVSKCMFCGLCTEVCPTLCIHHTPEFEAVTRDIRNLILHFVDEPLTPYRQKKGAPLPELAPLGSIALKKLKAWDAGYVQFEKKPLPPPPPPVEEVDVAKKADVTKKAVAKPAVKPAAKPAPAMSSKKEPSLEAKGATGEKSETESETNKSEKAPPVG